MTKKKRKPYPKGFARGMRDYYAGRTNTFGVTIYSGKYLTNWRAGYDFARKQKLAADKIAVLTKHTGSRAAAKRMVARARGSYGNVFVDPAGKGEKIASERVARRPKNARMKRIAARMEEALKPPHFRPVLRYVIFSKKDQIARLGWGIFVTLKAARDKRKIMFAQQFGGNVDVKLYGICRADLRAMPGRTW